jgi:hypothetical protein
MTQVADIRVKISYETRQLPPGKTAADVVLRGIAAKPGEDA